MSDIDFAAEVKFDSRGFLTKAEGILDNRKVDVEEVLKTFTELSQSVADGDSSKIDDLCTEAKKCVEALAPLLKGAPVTIGDLYGLMYGNYMTVVPEIQANSY